MYVSPSPSTFRILTRGFELWHLAHLPMGDTSNYDRFGNQYNISRVLTPEKRLNITALEDYSDIYISPPYLTATFVVFMLSTCIITHTALYHWRTIWNAMWSIDPEEEDIHARLMKAYPEVPTWWYCSILIFFFLMAVFAVTRWPTDVPVYLLVVAIAVPALYVVPGGLIFAVTGQIVSQTLEGLWELADDIFSYSPYLICWVKLSLELCSLGTPSETWHVASLLYLLCNSQRCSRCSKPTR